MPIINNNDSLALTVVGHERALRDSCRNRKGKALMPGPASPSRPYQPPAQKALQNSLFKNLILEYDDQDFNKLSVDKKKWIEERAAQQSCVLPMPLVDIILYSSRISQIGRSWWWYPSSFRPKWARFRLNEAAGLVQAHPQLAAEAIASVIGTTLPAVLVKSKGTEEEIVVFRLAWDMLSPLVDEPIFLQLFLSAANISIADKEPVPVSIASIIDRLSSASNIRPCISLHQAIGPMELRLAEDIDAAQNRCWLLDKRGHSEGWTPALRNAREKAQHALNSAVSIYNKIITSRMSQSGWPRLGSPG